MKTISWCGKLSFLIGFGSLLFGVYLLYKELMTNNFVAHQSIAVAFICLGLFFLFHFSLKVLEANSTHGSSCRIKK